MKISKGLENAFLNLEKCEESQSIRFVRFRNQYYFAFVDSHPMHSQPQIVTYGKTMIELISNMLKLAHVGKII